MFSSLFVIVAVFVSCLFDYPFVESSKKDVITQRKELEAFLLDGEALFYENIEIEYIHGENPVLIIYERQVNEDHDDEELPIEYKEMDRIDLANDDAMLSDYHKLMLDKGFIRKSDFAIEEIQRQIILSKLQESYLQHRIRIFSKKRRIHLNEFRDNVIGNLNPDIQRKIYEQCSYTSIGQEMKDLLVPNFDMIFGDNTSPWTIDMKAVERDEMIQRAKIYIDQYEQKCSYGENIYDSGCYNNNNNS